MVELRWLEVERTAVLYIRGSDCTTTGMRCTCLASLLGLEGGTGCMMCKYDWPRTPEREPTRGPEVNTEGFPEEIEAMTEGEDDVEDDEKEDGEKAEVIGEAVEKGGEDRVLLIDRSTGSV